MRTTDQGNGEQALRKRRQLITGAATAVAGAALLSVSREAKANAMDVANVQDWGPVNGTWDFAVQQALATGKAIYFPPGDYPMSASINVANRDLVIYGDGPDVSRLLFWNATNGLVFTGQRFPFNVNQLMVHDIGFVAAHPGCETAIHCSWTSAGGADANHPYPLYCVIERVTVTCDNGNARFRNGIYHGAGRNSRIVNCTFSQLNLTTFQRDAVAIHLAINGEDNQIVGCQFDKQATAIVIDPNVEGTRVVDCSFLGTLVGIRANGAGSAQGVQWLHVTGCHFAVAEVGIDAISVMQLRVHDNYFLPINMFGNTRIGIRITRVQTGNTLYFDDACISDNVFHNHDTSSPPAPAYGVFVVGASSANRCRGVLIDGNQFGGIPWTNTVVFGQFTTMCRYTDTNLLDGPGGPSDVPGSGNSISHVGRAGAAVTSNTSGQIGGAEIDWILDGRLVCYHVKIVVTVPGGSGSLNVVMPYRPVVPCSLSGMNVGGPACQGIIGTDGVLRVVYYNGTYPGGAGTTLQLSGTSFTP
jgi:hypothetical protein